MEELTFRSVRNVLQLLPHIEKFRFVVEQSVHNHMKQSRFVVRSFRRHQLQREKKKIDPEK